MAKNLDKNKIQWLWSSVQDSTSVENVMDKGKHARLNTPDYLPYYHDFEMVMQYEDYFIPVQDSPGSTCLKTNQLGDFFILYMILPALVVIILLSFLKRRKSLGKNCCYSRPHLLYPINLIDDHEQRWAYAAVFAIITYKVLSLFDGVLFWTPEAFNDPEWMKKYGWTEVFVVMLNVAMLCVVYYPFLACLVLRRMIIANVVALLYAVPWLWYFFDLWFECPFWEDSHPLLDENQAIMNFVLEVPIAIAFLCLIGTYIYNLVVSIKKRRQNKSEVDYPLNGMLDNLMETDPDAVQYVRDLLKRQPKEPPQSTVAKLKEKLTYRRLIGFKYSPCVLCTMVVAGIGIYKTSILFTGYAETHYHMGLYMYESLGKRWQIPEEIDVFCKDFLTLIRWSVLVSIWISCLLHAVFMVHMMITYRQHLRKYFQGDRSWHFKDTSAPVDVMLASLQYSGYQMAYVLWGYIIVFLLATASLVSFGMIIVLPFKYNFRGPILDFLIDYWPAFLVGIILEILQKHLAKRCLLQEKGKYIALNNRRFYHVVSFFFFFYNFLGGLLSCLKRILFSVGFGTLFVSRLDHCILMRGFEQLDHGFSAYIGRLTIDVYHNHPVMKTFIFILKQLQDDKCNAGTLKYRASVEGVEKGLTKEDKKTKENKKYRNKWFKAVTLMRNPTLRMDLMKDGIKKQTTSAKQAVSDDFMEQTGEMESEAFELEIPDDAT